ncbi:MAG: hypothetical protein NC212_00620 [Staphylococcus sp.]|nr:hypothetical protein [Staphylococcus sp.]
MINYYIAEVKIDKSNTQSAINKIDSIAATSSDPVLKSILSTLQADIYMAYYLNDRWKYNSRSLPLTPLPADITEWSGEQFKAHIISLISAAMSHEAELKKVPISAYESVITNDGSPRSVASLRLMGIYYPTLFDFVASTSVSILKKLQPSQTFLSWGLLTRHNLYISFPFTKYDPVVSQILGIYASLLKFHETGSAPFINTDVNRIKFVTDHIYRDYSSDSSSSETDNRKIQLLKDLYQECRQSEFSGDILLAIYESFGFQQKTVADKKWLYANIEHNIESFKAYPRRNELINYANSLKKKSVSITYPTVAAPGVPVKFNLDLNNVSTGKIYVFDVSTSPVTATSVNNLPARSSAIAVIPFKSPNLNQTPFADKIEVEYTFPKIGSYVAIASFDGEATNPGRIFYPKIHITHYSLASSRFDTTKLWALDAMTGAPIQGAEIHVSTRKNRQRIESIIGKTNADGSLITDKYGDAWMTYAGDKYAMPLYTYNVHNTPEAPSWRMTADGFSSLAIYHPGDSVEWMAIVYEYCGTDHRVVANKKVTAVLYDASHNPLDTLSLTTDDFGRVTGTFTLPEDCLSGHFTISINEFMSLFSFMVSDYKLPSFFVDIEPAENDTPALGDVTLKGKVKTYSGFPLADAKLRVTLYAAPSLFYWYNRSNPVEFQTIDAETDVNGNFEIVLTKDILDLSPIPAPIFTAKVSALSETGESQEKEVRFVTSKKYSIRTSIPENINVATPSTQIKAQVVDYRDSIVSMPIDIAISKDSTLRFSGKISADSAAIDLTGLPSGKYDLKLSLADADMASSVTKTVVLYRPTDRETPVPGTLLWYPETQINIDVDGSGSWLYAVDCPTNLLVTIHDDDKILSQRWIKTAKGMTTLPLHLPEGIDLATVDIALTGNYRSATASLKLKRDITKKSIRFKTESFRDKLVPGSEETWTFRIVDGSANGVKAAVILDMYNTALDALASYSLDLYPTSDRNRLYYSWDQPALNQTNSFNFEGITPKSLSSPYLGTPDFYTYGQPWIGSLMIRGNMAMAKMALGARSASQTNGKYESDAMVTTEEAVYEVMSSADSGAAPEAAPEKETGIQSQEIPFSYREREVALAFFRPMLTSDENGHLSFTFTVPNANTTWGFKALAYTDSLISTNFSASVIANKPVMVQPNLPRFLRAGDSVVVKASVMNNSDSEQSVVTTIEIFDATTGKTLSKYDKTDVIAAGSSVVVENSFEAPTDKPFIGYRIKSSTEDFADGEQTLLPVLPAVAPVIDSYPFYITPADKDFSMALPQVPTDARVSLQFCENPTWYVVTALPGLLDINASTANEAAASIFSAAIASGLLRDNPSIAEALKAWSESDKSDGTLTSMLQKNEDLKQVLLASTPWMLDAKNDSERMSRLSLLFDSKTVSTAIKDNISMLKKLSRGGGGWAWNSYCNEPSMWATENVLLLFGELLKLGYLPESKDLSDMILKSIKWIDSETAQRYKKAPDSDYSLYIFLRDNFKKMKNVPAVNSRIVNATTQRILSKWKNVSTTMKGIYAIILANNGQPAVAKTILASLREYSTYSPAKGMWWPSLDDMTVWSMDKIGATSILLDAFATVEPGCQDIDRIRQWLILQKEAKDWGTSVTTSSVVASILSTSSRWIAPAGGAVVTVAGKKVEPTDINRFTGYFRTTVPLTEKSKGDLKVTRKSDSPAWGALYYLYTDSMTTTKAHACDDLSVEKRLIVDKNYTDSLCVGDKVTVQLTLKVGRDMDYVTVVDERPACYEPVEQIPAPLYSEGICFYRENKDASTRLFITHLPKGVYILTYDVWANNAGSFASGVATVQSQYAPQLTAHSSGSRIDVSEGDQKQ